MRSVQPDLPPTAGSSFRAQEPPKSRPVETPLSFLDYFWNNIAPHFGYSETIERERIITPLERLPSFDLLEDLPWAQENSSPSSRPDSILKRDPYSTLECKDEERKKIARLFEILVHPWPSGQEQEEAKRIGKEIEHLHPLRFLGEIFSNPVSKEAIKQLSRSWSLLVTWLIFFNELSNQLDSSADRGSLLIYLPGFAAKVAVPSDQLRAPLERRNWKQLIEILCN